LNLNLNPRIWHSICVISEDVYICFGCNKYGLTIFNTCKSIIKSNVNCFG
jgi:hypothetical protein